MGTQTYDLDINAKLPIIRVESLSKDDLPVINGTSSDNQYINQHQQQTNGLTFKKPSFRRVDPERFGRKSYTIRIARKRKDAPVTKDSYFHYEEPSREDILNRVEYDMDDQDIQWLQDFNDRYAKPTYNLTLSDTDFERIMDRLEKESSFQINRENKDTSQEDDEEAVCSICNDGQSDNNGNTIVFCDMCDLPVHQDCYGVPYLPDGPWLCRRCLQSPSQNVECELCPNLGGAFKQTENGKWAHVLCALWIPEVCFANTVFLEPIDGIQNIDIRRWRMVCYICKQKNKGACIQCHKPNCYQPFHVTCAQQAGLYMKIKQNVYNTAEGPLTDVKKEAYCDDHDPKNGRRRGGMYECEDSEEEEVSNHAYKKWQRTKKDQMKKTRKILASKRERAPNPISEPFVPNEKLDEISRLLIVKSGSKRKSSGDSSGWRELVIRHMLGYWKEKRRVRNGVPLLRCLQVSLNSSSNSTSVELTNSSSLEKFQRFRYDLEKSRLLVGEVKKREQLKRRLIFINKDYFDLKFKQIDQDEPPTLL